MLALNWKNPGKALVSSGESWWLNSEIPDKNTQKKSISFLQRREKKGKVVP